ncbi:hypothetical protein D9M73_252900 [compost metagenome]
MDTHHFQPGGMSADFYQFDAWIQLTVTVMKYDSLLVYASDDIHHVFDIERMAQRWIKHVSASCETYLGRLHMESRHGK